MNGDMMLYTGAISEMIKGNTQNCVDKLEDIKSAIVMLNQRAVKNEIEAKVYSLHEKIENWDLHDNANDLARWFNELRELVGDDEIDIPYLSGDCFQMDLYHRIEAIFPLITCVIDSNVLYRNDNGVFVVENINVISKKHLTEADKRAVAHILVDQMEDNQLDEVLKTWV